MRRRSYLRLATVGLVGGVAGCTDGTEEGADPPSEGGAVATSDGGDPELPVTREEMFRGAPKDAIPAIVDPVFDEDWSGLTVDADDVRGSSDLEPRLQDDDEVVGVARNGEARAYPLSVLNWHEVVNDDFGEPLLVTYCPLCGSAVTAVRRADGEETIFGVSGLLWRNDLVMYDEATGSLWSQIIATAVNGELTGEELELVPSTLTTWGDWRSDHPETVVLRPPPESGTVAGGGARNYTRDPYEGYEETERIGIAGNFEDDRLHPKTEVLGVAHGDVARAYPTETVREEDVINDEVDGLPVVVTAVGETPVAYVREVDGGAVEFSADGDRHLAAAGSRWRRSTGDAVDGPHEGARLEQANDVSPQFWFAWLDFHPDSELYRE